MNAQKIAVLKQNLQEKIFFPTGGLHAERMSRENFLRELWQTLSIFLRLNRRDSLIHFALSQLKHGDIIPRMFTIFTIRYGSFPQAVTKGGILKEFVDMLDKDLVEEELSVYAYAKGKSNTFFPECAVIMQNIREVYGTREFDRDLLPPTPYYAYCLLALNRRDDVLNMIEHAKLFGELYLLSRKMTKGYTLLNIGVEPKFDTVR